MNISSNWLREHLGRTILSDEQIVQALERAGIEVEQIISSPTIDSRIIVGLVKKVIQHPNANRLHLVEVATSDANYSIVCGAPNVREGLKVAIAQIGAVLPSGDRIEKAKLRGEISEGMLCSQRELGLGNDHEGILELPLDTPVGALMSDLYPPDTVIDIKTQANRFDIQSVIGLAREVAAMTGAQLLEQAFPLLTAPINDSQVEHASLASRYMLGRFKVDQTVPSPSNITSRLRSAGMRSINPVVDATNYVMIETGQPLHAFDASKVHLPIQVRYALKGEKLTTLDNVTRSLTEEDLIIADQNGPLGLAGVMGGEFSEVGPNTDEILLESAVFDRTIVRKMAKRHGLRTEASARFERGLPLKLPSVGMVRAVELIRNIAKGELTDLTDLGRTELVSNKVMIASSWLSKFVGISISHNKIIESLAKLQIPSHLAANDVKRSKKSHMTLDKHDAPDLEEVIAVIPWWRPDLKLPEDIAEEVVRVIGYDKIPSSIPPWLTKNLIFDNRQSMLRKLRDLLYGIGLFEVMTYSFVSSEKLQDLGRPLDNYLKLKNPLSSEQAYLRDSLLPSHLDVLERNRTYSKTVGFYEISKTFIKSGLGKQPDEPLRLAVMMNRQENAYRYLKGALDALAGELNVSFEVRSSEDKEFAPGRSGEVYLGDVRIGRIGQVHPNHVTSIKVSGEAAFFEIDLYPLLDSQTTKQFMGLERFPTIQRDLGIIVPMNVSWQSILDSTQRFQVSFVEDYYGKGLEPGYKAVTVRINVTGADRTPTEADAVELESKIFGLLERKVGAKRRD